MYFPLSRLLLKGFYLHKWFNKHKQPVWFFIPNGTNALKLMW